MGLVWALSCGRERGSAIKYVGSGMKGPFIPEPTFLPNQPSAGCWLTACLQNENVALLRSSGGYLTSFSFYFNVSLRDVA